MAYQPLQYIDINKAHVPDNELDEMVDVKL